METIWPNIIETTYQVRLTDSSPQLATMRRYTFVWVDDDGQVVWAENTCNKWLALYRLECAEASIR